MSKRSIHPIRLAISSGTLAAALALAGTVSAADSGVAIASFAFSPPTITVSVGDTVTWTNGDDVPHSATGTGFDSGSIPGGSTGSVTFATAGTFPYACSFHPAMQGAVVVQAASGGVTHGDGVITAPPTNTDAAVVPAAAQPGSGAAPVLLVLAALAGIGLGARRRAPARTPRAES